MKLFVRNKIKHIFSVLIIIFAGILTYFPVRNAKFWLVDDGMSIMVAQKIQHAISDLRLFDLAGLLYEGGRLRPVYWLIQYVSYLFGENNAGFHFLFHIVLISLTVVVIYFILYNLTKSTVVSLLFSLIFLVSPVNGENIYRLGPLESYIALFTALTVYFYLRKKEAATLIFLFLSIYLKETGFVILAPLFTFFVYQKVVKKTDDKFTEKLLIYGTLFTIPVIMVALLNMKGDGYVSNYIVSFEQIVSSLKIYYQVLSRNFYPFFQFVLLLITVDLLRFNMKELKNSKDTPYRLFLLSYIVAYLVVQSPWVWVMERYMMPLTVGLVIIIGLELNRFFNKIKLRGYYKSVIAIVFIVFTVLFYIVPNFHTLYVKGVKMSIDTNFQSLIVKRVSELPVKSVVYLNFVKGDGTMELYYELGWHLSLFYGRDDIEIKYFDTDIKPTSDFYVLGTKSIPEGYPEQAVDLYMKRFKPVKYEEELKGGYIIYTSPVNIIKQIVKKTYYTLTKNSQFTHDGIYTDYVESHRLYIYKVSLNK